MLVDLRENPRHALAVQHAPIRGDCHLARGSLVERLIRGHETCDDALETTEAGGCDDAGRRRVHIEIELKDLENEPLVVQEYVRNLIRRDATTGKARDLQPINILNRDERAPSTSTNLIGPKEVHASSSSNIRTAT